MAVSQHQFPYHQVEDSSKPFVVIDRNGNHHTVDAERYELGDAVVKFYAGDENIGFFDNPVGVMEAGRND